MKMIDPRNFQSVGTKRFEMQAIEYLTQNVAILNTDVRLKDQAFQ